MTQASLVCLGPTDKTEKSGSWRPRERPWKTTTPTMLRRSDACALSAGCPCGPRAGSAAPRSAAGEDMAEPSQASTPAPATQPRPLQSPAPAPTPTPAPSPASAPTPAPTPAPAPAPAAAPAGSTGTGGPGVGSGGTGSGGGSGSTWSEPAAARQPEEGASPGAAARQEAREARGLLGLQGGGGAWGEKGAGLGASRGSGGNGGKSVAGDLLPVPSYWAVD